ncbi:MAG: NUDIX domain-containing protein [Myxococcota bacterium]
MSEENPFTVLASREVYDNPWIRVIEHRVEKPRGGEGIYGVVHFKNRAVGVVPYQDGYVWMVGQYRFALARYSWEIPEGGAPFGEDLEDCARRELAEETGLIAERLDYLLSLHLSNSVTDEAAHIYLARDLSAGSASPEDTEVLKLRRVSLDEVYAQIRSGVVTDVLTVTAIQQLLLMRHEGTL